ncbi:MAG TPA: hypothetical protein VJ277_09660 [Gemmatimonadales bacterium]|nr:hypothetical protein [Gemmatimonadales bacterium]
MKKRLRLGQGAFVTASPRRTGILYCFDMVGSHFCWRPQGHEGRHADIGALGDVRAVWGEDVHAETRAEARRNARIRQLHADGTIAARAPRKTIHIETAQTWDGVAR